MNDRTNGPTGQELRLAQVIKDFWWECEAGSKPPKHLNGEPTAGDVALASHILNHFGSIEGNTPTDHEREVARRLLNDANPKHRQAPLSMLADDIRIVASAVLRRSEVPEPSAEAQALVDAVQQAMDRYSETANLDGGDSPISWVPVIRIEEAIDSVPLPFDAEPQGEPSDAPTPEEWREHINAERLRQAEHGYDRTHDDRHGVDHLLTWAQDYARRGKAIASAALVEAAREVLSRPVPSAAIRRLEEEISQPDVDLAIEGKAYVTVDAKDIREILAALRAASAVTEQAALDPMPWVFVSDQVFGVRSATDKGFHSVSGTYYVFQPRREYEQDRTRYEFAAGAR